MVVIGYFKRHPLISAIIVLIFFTLPSAIDTYWDLYEKIKSEAHMPHINLGIGIWLLPLIGVVLAIFILRQNRQSAPIQEQVKHDKLVESLIRARTSAQELRTLPINANLNSTAASSPFSGLVVAEMKYQAAIKLLKHENPRRDILLKSLLKGLSVIDTCKRKNSMVEFKAELDSNSMDIINQVDAITTKEGLSTSENKQVKLIPNMGELETTIRLLKTLNLTIGDKSMDALSFLVLIQKGLGLGIKQADIVSIASNNFSGWKDAKEVWDCVNSTLAQLSIYNVIYPDKKREANVRASWDEEYWKFTDLGKRVITEQIVQQPTSELVNVKFSVAAKVYNVSALLEVTNQSQIETFRGTVRIAVNNNYSLEMHRLYWDGYGSEAKLGNGDIASVLVARLEWLNREQIALHLVESNVEKPSSFIAKLYNVRNGGIENNSPLYLEVIIKPISSSKTEHREYYELEQPSVMKLDFRKIDAIPSTSGKGSSQT